MLDLTQPIDWDEPYDEWKFETEWPGVLPEYVWEWEGFVETRAPFLHIPFTKRMSVQELNEWFCNVAKPNLAKAA